MLIKTFTIIAGLTGMILMAACSRSSAEGDGEKSQQPRAVLVAAVKETTAPIPVTASGRVASAAEMLLSFKIGGVIERILVDEGQAVVEDQLLAHLNRIEIDARVSQSKNAFEKATRDLNRVENLYRDTVATLEQFEDARTGYELARAELEVAQFNLRYARIVAPGDGWVLKRFGEVGELVNAGMPVVRIGTTGSAAHILRVGVTDRDVLRLSLGDSARVHFDAHQGVRFAARVSEIAAAADPRTGVFEVELTLGPTPLSIKNGFIGKVTLYPSNQAPYYRIPMGAMVEGRQDQVHVMVPNSNRSAARKLTLRPDYVGRDYFTVLVRDAGSLSEVITEGAAYIRDGEAIAVEGESDHPADMISLKTDRPVK